MRWRFELPAVPTTALIHGETSLLDIPADGMILYGKTDPEPGIAGLSGGSEEVAGISSARKDVKQPTDGLWRSLGRLRILLGLGLLLLALALLPYGDYVSRLLAVLFTAGFIGANAVGLVCRPERRKLVELASMLFGVGAISCLVVATGGADGPLLFLFLVPVFTYGSRSGPRAAYLSAAVNSAALAVISAASLRDDFSAPRLLGPLVVAGLMWLEARAVALVVRHLAAQRDELMQLAQRDPLTGLLNRRSLYELVGHMAAEGREFAVVLVDLDSFKAANDERGHLFGDEVLKRVAQAMQRAVRRGDAVARYGGDEFAVVVPGGREEGEHVMRRLEKAVEKVGREMDVDIGLSGGVSVWPAEGATFEELLQAADRRLYRAKELKGRTRPDLDPSW